jgi:hypothetical protein
MGDGVGKATAKDESHCRDLLSQFPHILTLGLAFSGRGRHDGPKIRSLRISKRRRWPLLQIGKFAGEMGSLAIIRIRLAASSLKRKM